MTTPVLPRTNVMSHIARDSTVLRRKFYDLYNRMFSLPHLAGVLLLSKAAAPGLVPPNRTVMAWMGWDGRTDAQLDVTVSFFINNTDAITTASPTSHSLGDNATLVERNLSKTATSTHTEVFKRLRAGGVRVLPTIWNDAGGMHTALLPKFMQLAAAPGPFIARAVALAVTEDLDGWNVDFELGAADWDAGDCRLVWPDPRWGPRCEKIQKAGVLFAAFLHQFATALHKAGKVLSVDIGTDTNPLCAPLVGSVPKIAKGCYSQWWMQEALNATAVDRFISMTTYQGFEHFVIGAASMLAGFGDCRGSCPTGLAGPTTGVLDLCLNSTVFLGGGSVLCSNKMNTLSRPCELLTRLFLL